MVDKELYIAILDPNSVVRISDIAKLVKYVPQIKSLILVRPRGLVAQNALPDITRDLLSSGKSIHALPSLKDVIEILNQNVQ